MAASSSHFGSHGIDSNDHDLSERLDVKGTWQIDLVIVGSFAQDHGFSGDEAAGQDGSLSNVGEARFFQDFREIAEIKSRSMLPVTKYVISEPAA